jgi:hypothetical protein
VVRCRPSKSASILAGNLRCRSGLIIWEWR